MKKELNIKLLLLATLASFGVILLGVTYIFAYSGNFYNSLFWISILLLGIPTFLIISDRYISQNKRITILFLFGTILYVMRIFSTTTNFHFQDELYTFETTRLIYEKGSLDINTHFEISKYYPGLEILTVFMRNFVDVSIFPIAKILIALIHSMILIFVYLFFKEISSSERLSAIGTFVYATNPLYIFFDALFAYESLGIFLVILLLYIISKKLSKGISIEFSILTIIALSSLVITHHLSSYMFLLFLSILIIIQSYKNLQQEDFSRLFLLSMIFILGWMIYIATVAINYLTDNFINRFSKIFELSLFGGEKIDIFSTSLSISLLPYYEFIIDTYIYAPSILFLSILGIYIVKKRKDINIFIYTLMIYGPILYVLSLVLIPTSGSEFAQRLWGFLYIGLSFLVGVVLNMITTGDTINQYKRNNFWNLNGIFSIIFVAVIIIGGVSIGNKPIHREPDLLSPKFASGAGSMTTDVFASADWFKKNFGEHNKMAGDRTTSIIFNSYGYQNVERWNSWKIFIPKEINLDVLSAIKSFRIDYLIVDIRMSKVVAEYGDYFGNSQIYKRVYPAYKFTEPLPTESIDKFNNYNMFDKFYDNGNIIIYEI